MKTDLQTETQSRGCLERFVRRIRGSRISLHEPPESGTLVAPSQRASSPMNAFQNMFRNSRRNLCGLGGQAYGWHALYRRIRNGGSLVFWVMNALVGGDDDGEWAVLSVPEDAGGEKPRTKKVVETHDQ